MRGHYPKRMEYESDNSTDVRQIIWVNDFSLFGRCGPLVDLWDNSEKQEAKERWSKETQRSEP